MTSLNADPRAVSLVQVASSHADVPVHRARGRARGPDRGAQILLIVLETFIPPLRSYSSALSVFFHWGDAGRFARRDFRPGFLLVARRAGLALDNAAAGAGARSRQRQRRQQRRLQREPRSWVRSWPELHFPTFGPAAPYWAFGRRRHDFGRRPDLVARSATPCGRRASRTVSGGRVRAGFRHAAGNANLRSTLVRTVAVYPFACAYTALLPLIAREQVASGPEFYGVLLAVVSVGAPVLGSFLLGRIRALFGPDLVVALGRSASPAPWRCSAWLAIPRRRLRRRCWRAPPGPWFWSAFSLGLGVPARASAGARAVDLSDHDFRIGHPRQPCLGQIAKAEGAPLALFIAAAGVLLTIPLSWRAKLLSAQTAGGQALL